MFLGWYDPDKKKPAHQKVAEGIERYVEKFGAAPITCLTNPIDAAELNGAKQPPVVAVRAVDYIPRWTFYIGVEDAPISAIAA